MNNFNNLVLSSPYNIVQVDIFFKALLLAVLFSIGLGEALAQSAANPLENVTVIKDTKDVGSILKWVIQVGGTGVLGLVMIFAFSSLMVNLVNSLKQALRDASWGEFFMYLMIVFFVLAVLIIIGMIAFTVLGNIGDRLSKV